MTDLLESTVCESDAPMTCDNLLLPTGQCTRVHEASADALVAEYLSAARADSTRRAYAADLAHFAQWGGQVPASADDIARYIAHYAALLRPGTLQRRLAGLASAHHDRGLPDPTKHPLVRRVMQGIARRHGCAPRRVAPLLVEDLARMVAAFGSSLLDLRDRALLLVGFFGALRRSELVALDCEAVDRTESGILLTIGHSKTDQTGRGRLVHLPKRADALCPVLAIDRWTAAAGLVSGALFRRAGNEGIGARLSDAAVPRIIKNRAQSAGLGPGALSGHSLRAGFATSAALAGYDAVIIARQTGHRSNRTLSAYVRPHAASLALVGSSGNRLPAEDRQA